MKYLCHSCDAFGFDPASIKEHIEGGYSRLIEICSLCKSIDIEEVVECDECGEAPATTDDYLCDGCEPTETGDDLRATLIDIARIQK